MYLGFKPKETSLVWTWRENSWKWVLREHVAMQINPVEGSMIKHLVKLDPKERLANLYRKSAAIFKEVRDKVAKDPDHVTMRKQWRASE